MTLSQRFWLITPALVIGGVVFAPTYILMAIHPLLPTSFRVVPNWYQSIWLSQYLRALLFSNLVVYLSISLLGIGAAIAASIWARAHWSVRGLLILTLLAIVAFPWVFRYQPALVAAPGYAMRVPTQPGWLDGVVKSNQSAAEIRPCTYTLLGWSADAMLFYQAQCSSAPTQTWAIAPDREANARLVASAPADLFAERASTSVLGWVRAASVSPVSEEPNARQAFLREGSLVSPNGDWVALIARHLYGPEDVVLVKSEREE
jgi:hypothetical protein